MNKSALFATSPHSGERIPPECYWLQDKDPITLLRDVDRFVDELYQTACHQLEMDFITTPWSRYVVDLNRSVDDVDGASVKGASAPPGEHLRGLHWQVTTWNEALISEPLSKELHEALLKDYYTPFHGEVAAKFQSLRNFGFPHIYHLDLHSMPSTGTALHSDPGKRRAQVVLSDFNGKSADSSFLSIVSAAFEKAGFQIAINDPYLGGGITQRYGRPGLGQHTLQVELNRALYMDEDTKERRQPEFTKVQEQLSRALKCIAQGVKALSAPAS